MPQNPKSGQNCYPYKSKSGVEQHTSLHMAITRHQNRLESCSSPLKTRED